DRSLERLGLPAVDVYLLHNPEYFLSDARRHGTSRPLDGVRDEFYRRVEAAFEALEAAAERGRLTAYGVSSNTFVNAAEDPEATSLTRLLEVARAVARRRHGNPEAHRFSVVQLPL